MVALENVASFDYLCSQVLYPFCIFLGTKQEPSCFSRNIEIGSRLFFQPGTLVIYLIALLMAGIMIHNIKVKYTAVGRKEIVIFFYLYLFFILLEFLVSSGTVTMASSFYVYFVALYMGASIACFWCLFINGCIPFQWYQDGTPRSVWFIRLSSLIVLMVFFIVALATMQEWPAFNASKPYALFIVYFGFQFFFLVFYLLFQVVHVFKSLEHRWPLGDLFFGLVFFLTGQILIYFFSIPICESANHYVDGFFFGAVFNLLSVMMVYKYWDSITKDDLEFAIPPNKIQLNLDPSFLKHIK